MWRTVNIPIELTSENAKIPQYAHLGDGAVDLYSPADYTINPGERIAQMIINKFEQAELIEVEILDETERGEGGFGSTGK